MRRFRNYLLTLVLASAFCDAQFNVTTQAYDNNRSGANLQETQLTQSNVNVTAFGKIWTYTVSGSVFAQPLYMANLTMPATGVATNVLFVVTMNDLVYAFDADGKSTAPIWSVDLTKQTNGTPVPITDIVQNNTLNIVGNVGIESTPVIDASTNTIYLVARTKESGAWFQRLHALDITTGAEKFGGPTVISGSVAGTGSASSGGVVAFDPRIENQRSALALTNGQLFIAWSSHEDLNAYHGWVMRYSASTLQQTGIFCDTPNGSMAGIWMSGRGPAIDAAGNAYYITGNGTWDGATEFGESFLKFAPTGTLSVLDWFTPNNYTALNTADEDLGSSGPILISGTDLIVGGGKQSLFYLMHTGNLGHENGSNGQIVETLNNLGGPIHSGPVYWNRSTGAGGPLLFEWSNQSQPMRSFHFNGSTFDATPVATGSISSAAGQSGGVLTFSANGSTAGTGIVWSSMPTSADGDHGIHPGILRAMNADNLQELWDSNLNASRDSLGNWPKYSAPFVMNGRVYIPSFPSDGVSNSVVSVYGELPTIVPTNPDFSLSVASAQLNFNIGANAGDSITITPVNGFTGAVSFAATNLPSGVSASFSSTSATAATVNFAATATAATGSFPVTITGTSGTLSHSVTITLQLSTSVPTLASGAISINFVGGGTAMAASEIAGVVPAANWNSAAGTRSAAALSLVNATGAATTAKATWSANGVWTLPIATTAGNFHMMSGYLDPQSASTPASVTVTGLPTSATGYDVYVYADGDNGTAVRTGRYQITGTGISLPAVSLTDSANKNFNGTFVLGNNSYPGNYVKFTINATQFTLTATPGTSGNRTVRSPLNGIQIVPHQTTISIDFAGGGTAMAATEIAGVVPSANWNSATGASSTASKALVDSTGAATTATVSWSSSGVWTLPITTTAGNFHMMEGYLDPTSGSASVSVTGLPTGANGYDVYVYADGDNGPSTRTGSYQLTGTGISLPAVTLTDSANTNFSGTYSLGSNSAGNYLKFSINANQFTLTATPSTASDGTLRSPVNGLQIVAR